MALNLEEKKAIVADVAAVASEANSLVVAEYRGLSVADMTRLRNAARGAGVYLHVVRNTLARLAITGTQFEGMQEVLTGPLFLAFSTEDPGAAARIIRDFLKENDKLIVKALSVGGQVFDGSQLRLLADLPTRDQAIAQLMSVMKAPITKWVRTVAETYSQAVRVMAAVRDQKQAASG